MSISLRSVPNNTRIYVFSKTDQINYYAFERERLFASLFNKIQNSFLKPITYRRWTCFSRTTTLTRCLDFAFTCTLKARIARPFRCKGLPLCLLTVFRENYRPFYFLFQCPFYNFWREYCRDSKGRWVLPQWRRNSDRKFYWNSCRRHRFEKYKSPFFTSFFFFSYLRKMLNRTTTKKYWGTLL